MIIEIKNAEKQHNNILLLTFDKFGSLYKLVPPDQKTEIKINKGMLIYCPDNLTYNSLRYSFVEDEEIDKDIGVMFESLETTESTTNPTASRVKPEAATAHFENLGLKKVLAVVLTVVTLVLLWWYWPIAGQFASFPASLLSKWFPAKIVGMSSVSLLGKALGFKALPVFAMRSFFFRMLCLSANCVWCGSFFAAYSWLMHKVFTG